MRSMPLNADVGEGLGRWTLGEDDALALRDRGLTLRSLVGTS
jgi:hypothetical protein